jgi:hypothetical protein
MTAYIHDDELKRETNKNGKNYWDTYIEEINELLGLRAQVLSLSKLENSNKLNGVRVLIIGSVSGENLTERMAGVIDEWVKAGGILIGFKVNGLDNVFGNEAVAAIKQEPDDYAISAYFELRPHQITHEIHPALYLEQRLFSLSDIQLVKAKGSVELARIWLLHQGWPVQAQYKEKRYPKTSLLQVIGDNSRKLPYADEITFILQNMIAQAPQPFIYQIPPMKGKIPDALLYYGGDEYHGPVELSLKASDWMKSKGLGYHINMCDNHPITQEELNHIKENGHEVSLYYRLHEEDNFTMKEEYYVELNQLFYKKFGYRPVCTVNKWLGWTGWAEPAKWMLKAGGKADNSFYSQNIPSDHPLHNGPSFGFGFGTSYPFYFYDDCKNGNKRIDFIEEPIICYEVGHRGSIDGSDKETRAASDVHTPIDMAVKYHLLMNMFYHPVYIANFPRCREAIEEILRYIEYIGAMVLHMGNDQVCRWWNARSRSGIDGIILQENSLQFRCNCAYPSGMIVKIPLYINSGFQVLCGSSAIPYKEKNEFGRKWIYFTVPTGEHKIELTGI